jgi:hypothetical protein
MDTSSNVGCCIHPQALSYLQALRANCPKISSNVFQRDMIGTGAYIFRYLWLF